MGKFLRNALFGIAVGDALGVPHEKKPRGSFKCLGWDYIPEPDRKRTWSDDTALTLAELDSLGTLKRVAFDAIMQNFMEWFLMGKFSCTGRCFGAGKSTVHAIKNYCYGKKAIDCGSKDIMSNGNGALMRIMPFCLLREEYRKTFNFDDAVGMTHRHPINLVACCFFDVLVNAIVRGSDLKTAYETAEKSLSQEEKELIQLPSFGLLSERPESEIKSGRFVLDTLWAAIWCVEKTTNYRYAVLKAVDLGDDSDTTASVAGGIAGLIYGIGGEKGVPSNWIEQLACRNWLEDAAEKTAGMAY